MEKVSVLKMACIIFVLCTTTAIASPAQTFTELYSFCSQLNCTDGGNPRAGLVQGTDGNFYGTTYIGGKTNYDGTVFKITPAGTLTPLSSSFLANSDAGLVLATDGDFFGTSYAGGAYAQGLVFKVTPGDTALIPLYIFCSETNCTDGANPYAGLVQATNGNFYGTTELGGAYNNGTVFKITPVGTLTTLYSFSGADGADPWAGLVQGTDGNFYGTTYAGGGYGWGTVFKMTQAGKLTVLHSFAGNPTDGAFPIAGLVQATDGNFYGTTSAGGSYVGNGYGDGTVFKMTPAGTLTTLHSFAGNPTDGANPMAGLAQATDGNFYGTTYDGGASDLGTVFKITPSGVLTTLSSFCTQGTCPYGFYPYAGIIQATDGNFYGTAYEGGDEGYGTVWTMSVGLRPFVETQTTSGKVGAAVTILGNNLTGATAVKFNGTAATFTATNTDIATKVPAGATTGKVTVTTASGGTLSSNVAFRVTPQLLSFSPTSGPAETVVTITGVSLKQTTKVTFGGMNASFAVVNDTTVTATVPTGAATGKIKITTKGGTATSATSFTVTE